MRRLLRADVPEATGELAKFLIGMLLMRTLDDGNVISGRIVETEAYTPDDPASHSFRGRTERNRAMFGRNFYAYVYFIYGSAYCLNVTSEAAGIGAAVLIRALEPLAGIAIVRARRGVAIPDGDLFRGPGRICKALDIDRRLDGADLETDRRLWLADDGSSRPAVGTSARIGLTRAADIHQRFYAVGSLHLSGRRSLSPVLASRSGIDSTCPIASACPDVI